MKRALMALAASALIVCGSLPAWAGTSKGQLIYVPCSSHVYHGVKTRPFELTITLLVRNTDPWRSMTLTAVEYRGTDGKLLKRYLDTVVVVPPLTTREFTVEQEDTSGGVGASFLVRWKADAAMNEPVAEAVMIGTSNSQGISFTSRGVVLQD
ncbi:DUF3124 domain-containing protein [Humidesulfovibrio idahonensis]